MSTIHDFAISNNPSSLGGAGLPEGSDYDLTFLNEVTKGTSKVVGDKAYRRDYLKCEALGKTMSASAFDLKSVLDVIKPDPNGILTIPAKVKFDVLSPKKDSKYNEIKIKWHAPVAGEATISLRLVSPTL